MAWQTSPITIWLRNMGRALGLNALLGKLMSGETYEERFESALFSRLRPEDIVWDIGANVGLYTRRFADVVGESGGVVAFEPSPANFRRLSQALAERKNCTAFNIGLADQDGELAFVQGADQLGATSRFAEAGDPDAILVSVERGDTLLAERGCPAPNALKVDVEGYELEVLQGFGEALSSPNLHTIAVEIHFGILAGREMPDAPAEIAGLLESHGFYLTWPDSSHVVAMRR